MLLCQKCGKSFERRQEINGKIIDLGGKRQQCLDCLPYKKPAKKRICQKCGKEFKPTAMIDSARRVLTSRKYCLICSPYKTRKFCGPNTSNKRTNYKTNYSVMKRKELKKRAVDYLGGKCQLCGYDKCIEALVFHHRIPKEKSFTIGGNITYWVKIEKELKKCDLLCSNCHIEKHAESK